MGSGGGRVAKSCGTHLHPPYEPGLNEAYFSKAAVIGARHLIEQLGIRGCHTPDFALRLRHDGETTRCGIVEKVWRAGCAG